MTPLTQALLQALRRVAHGGALRDLTTARHAFVELRDAALRPGQSTSAVERVCLRALTRFHARYNDQARLDVCTPATFNALLRAALCDADRAGLDASAAIHRAMSVIAAAQGTGPLVPRCTLRSSDGQTTVGDFEMGPWRHDGRWRVVCDARGIRFADIDVGRRLARCVGTHALEIALSGAGTLRDIAIAPTPDGYVITGRPRRKTGRIAYPTVDALARLHLTASGIVDWPSFAYAATLAPVATDAEVLTAPTASDGARVFAVLTSATLTSAAIVSATPQPATPVSAEAEEAA